MPPRLRSGWRRWGSRDVETATIRHLADAIDALRAAQKATVRGDISDEIKNALEAAMEAAALATMDETEEGKST